MSAQSEGAQQPFTSFAQPCPSGQHAKVDRHQSPAGAHDPFVQQPLGHSPSDVHVWAHCPPVPVQRHTPLQHSELTEQFVPTAQQDALSDSEESPESEGERESDPVASIPVASSPGASRPGASDPDASEPDA
jgi:hypothetical protein